MTELQRPATADDLLALGLTSPEAVVLHAALGLQEATAGQLSTATGLSASAISTALSGLCRRGLLERVVGRRPAVVFVSRHAEAAVRRLEAEVQRSLDDTAQRVAAGVAAVAEAAIQAASRSRPMYEIRPSTDGRDPDFDYLRRGRTAHDEVVAGGPSVLRHWGPAHRCPTRLLVTREAVGPLPELERRLGHRGWGRPETEVRIATATVADLLILDGDRVRVSGSSPHGRVDAWSREPAHVAAASQLFTLWWDSAEPGFRVATRVAPPLDESELDVEEWDPAEWERCLREQGS